MLPQRLQAAVRFLLQRNDVEQERMREPRRKRRLGKGCGSVDACTLQRILDRAQALDARTVSMG